MGICSSLLFCQIDKLGWSGVRRNDRSRKSLLNGDPHFRCEPIITIRDSPSDEGSPGVCTRTVSDLLS